MPANKAKLQTDLLIFFKDTSKKPEQAAKELAAIIDSYVKSADVIVNANGIAPPGIPTAGSPAAQVTTAPVQTKVTGKGKII